MAPPKDNAFYEAASFSTSNKTHQLITCRWESLAVLWASDLATEISISLTESGIVGWITVSWKIWNRKWDTNLEPRQLNTLWSTSMLGWLIWPAIKIKLSLANSQWAGQKWNLASVLLLAQRMNPVEAEWCLKSAGASEFSEMGKMGTVIVSETAFSF